LKNKLPLEQLKALQEISKKQQFDKLISELRSRDPMATAIDNLNFGDIKKDFFSPDKKDARKIEKERAVAIRTKNSDVLTSQIQDRVDKTSKLLDLDDKKRERGEAGLSASERSRLLIDLTRAKTTEQVSLEADARKDEIRSRNLSTSSGAAKAVESARFQVVGGNGGGAGSFENLQKAVQILINKASEIPDPNNQDRQDLLALAASINETKTSQVGSSGVYENEKLSISTLLAGIQKEVENARNSAAKSGKFIDTSGAEKKANIYSEAKRALEEGGGADASKILSTFVSLGLKPSNQEEVNTVKDLISSTKNKSDRDKDKAFGSSILDKAKRDNGITDWSAAFTASATPIVASNTALNEALRNLGTDVRNLSGIMAKEAEIAGLSVNYSEAKNKEAELAAKVANLNGIIGSKSVLPEEWKRKDRLSKDPDTTSFMDLGNGPQNGSYASANPILVKEFEMAKAAASRLKKVNDAGTLTGRKGDRGDEYHLQAREEDLRVVKAYLEKQNDDHKLSMANTWEGGVLQPLKTNMVGKEAVSEDIIKLKETISELTKSILESNKAALELNKAKESKSTDAQSSNTDVTVNVSGLSDALGSLGPQIVALIESTTRNFLSMKEKAPKLFESMGSSNQAYA
jgi:hypothetical protein